MVKKVKSKSPVKKANSKKIIKKSVDKKTVSKSVKKQLDSNKKTAQKAVKSNISQDKEIAKLKEDIQKLKVKNKDKKNTRRVTEYNLFIRKQINSGLTFEKAVKEWNKYKKLESKNTRRPSAYNQFIGSQMRLGKTFEESVALWRLAKSGKLGKKGTTRTITKIKYKTRNIKSKPQVITKVKKVSTKPKVITKIKYRTKKVPITTTKTVEKEIDYDRIRAMLLTAVNTSTVSKNEVSSKSISVTDIKKAVSADDEEIAFKLIQTYFIEIARFGLKKQLTLDEIIDSYIYSLARVKRNESIGLDDKVKKAGLKK